MVAYAFAIFFEIAVENAAGIGFVAMKKSDFGIIKINHKPLIAQICIWRFSSKNVQSGFY